MTSDRTGPKLTSVSIIIKALNEEKNIARTVESALRAANEIGGGEVILADSLSVDGTVAIASRYPIRIVQLGDISQRCCGVGAQLGFLIASGEFLYILDGDMELEPGFLGSAIALLREHPRVAGVGGRVREMHEESIQFRTRSARDDGHKRPGRVDRLDMGGLYRRSSIEEVGYFTNRNLHAFEEFELAARLQVAGWELRRIDVPAIRHYGHSDNTLQLLLRRWRSRYAWGHGELLRSAWRKPHFWAVLTGLRLYRLQAGVIGFWLLFLLSMLFMPGYRAEVAAIAVVVSVFTAAVLAMKKRSWSGAFFSLFSWHVGVAGLARGLLARAHGRPDAEFDFRILA